MGAEGDAKETTDAVDIAIVTVLDEEYRAVHELLRAARHLPGTDGAPNLYGWEAGHIDRADGLGSYRVVLALAGRAGTVSASEATVATALRWNPRYVMLLGIAGGLPIERCALGDVVISSVIYGYEYGKLEGVFQPRPHWVYRSDGPLLASATRFAIVHPEWNAGLGDGPAPKALFGVVASGEKVVDDPTNAFFDAVQNVFPKLQAVEMEGAGAASAIDHLHARGKRIGFIMVRGVSDMPRPAQTGPQAAERGRNKVRACAAAARFATRWIASGWPVAEAPPVWIAAPTVEPPRSVVVAPAMEQVLDHLDATMPAARDGLRINIIGPAITDHSSGGSYDGAEAPLRADWWAPFAASGWNARAIDWDGIEWDRIHDAIYVAGVEGSLEIHIGNLNRLRRAAVSARDRAHTNLLLGAAYQKNGDLRDATYHLRLCIAANVPEAVGGFGSLAGAAQATLAKTLTQAARPRPADLEAALQALDLASRIKEARGEMLSGLLWRTALVQKELRENRSAEVALAAHAEFHDIDQRANHEMVRSYFAAIDRDLRRLREYSDAALHYFAGNSSLPGVMRVRALEAMAELQEGYREPTAYRRLLIASALLARGIVRASAQGTAETLRLGRVLFPHGATFLRVSWRLMVDGWPQHRRYLDDDERRFDAAYRHEQELITNCWHDLRPALDLFLTAPSAAGLTALFDD